jgi:hypothetical protein
VLRFIATWFTLSSPSPPSPNPVCMHHPPVFAQVMKNWQPLLLGPLFAMDKSPGPVCLPVKFSSSKRLPYMHRAPVPSPLTKSPPCDNEWVDEGR